jgi:phenylpropionate dioxygenase-like ring-hydroxylating dioxygenase large terminal subunit
MNAMPGSVPWSELIKPDCVHGSLYRDAAFFRLELERIWYRTWIYVGHESEIPNRNDFVAKSIARQQILMTRDSSGKIHLLLNRCTHRGNQVCAREKGNARNFTCPFHSWNFANDGRLVGYAFPEGYQDLDRSRLGLGRVPRVESYKGFVFGSFAEDGPSLKEHLGGAADTIDRLAMTSPEGEVQITAGQLEVRARERDRRLPSGLRALLDLRRGR